MHIRTNAQTHKQDESTQTHKHTYIHAYMHAKIRIYIHKNIRLYILKYTLNIYLLSTDSRDADTIKLSVFLVSLR
jgi:hypothetical protein